MAVNLVTLVKRAVLSKRRRSFLRDDSGVTVIEFGLLALPFFSIIGAILETSVIFLSSQILYTGVQDTSRLIRTGQAQSAGYNLASFRSNLCGRLVGLFDCSTLHIEVQVMNNFNSASITPPINFSCANTTASPCDWTRAEAYTPGRGNDVIMVQVYYKWPVILNLAGVTWANLTTGQRVLGGAAVFRNEPFL